MGRAVLALFFLLSSLPSLVHAGPLAAQTRWFDEGVLAQGGNPNCIGSGIVCAFNAVTGKLDITVAASVVGEANALSNNGTNCTTGNAALGIDTVGNAEGCFDVMTQTEGDAHTTATTAHSATAANTASRIVLRDGSGNFAAGTITATLSGNATTATSATSATSATTATSAGTATTATALAANGTNASAGNAILGVDASGNAEGSFDVATQTELNTHTTSTTPHSATATPTADRLVMGGGNGKIAAGWLPLPTASTLGAVLTGGNCDATTGKQIGIGTDGLPVCGVDQNSGEGGGGGSQGLQDVVTIQRRVTDAIDQNTCVGIGGLTHYVCIYGNASEGAVIAVSPAQDLTWTLAATKDFFFKAADGSTIMSIDNDTETMSLLNPLALASGGTGQVTAQLAINALTGVAAATNEQCLMKDTGTGNATYKDCAGGADSIGAPATTTDNAVAVYDGTDGTLLKNSLVLVDPITGNITTPGTISAGAGGSGGGGWVFTEGTAPSAPATNTIQVYAPVDVTTAYGIALPAASATGFVLGTNASNVNTLSFVGFSGSGNVLRQTNPVFDTYADMTEASAPATPGAGVQRLYAKTGGSICGKNSAGTETCTGSVAGGSFTLANLNTAISDADVATIAGTETLTGKTLTSPTIAKISNLTTNGYVKTTGSDGTLSVVTAPTLTVTRPMKMSTISVSNANAFMDTVDGTNFDYSALRFVDAVTGDTFWTYSVPPGVAATPAWNVIVTSKAVSGAGGNVVVSLNCKAFATNVAFDAALTSLQSSTVYAINTSANTTITTLNGTNYDGTAAIAAGNFLVCQLSRVGGSGSDTLNVDWLVLDVSIRLDVNVGT